MGNGSRTAIALALAAGLALAACGDDDDDTTSATSATTTQDTAAASTAPSSDSSPATTEAAPATTEAAVTAEAPATTEEAATAEAAEPTGEPYKIGIPMRQSGPGVAAYTSAPITATAWQDWVNAKGGINGHPVEVYVEDTAGDAAKGLTVTQGMVEDQGVVYLHPEDPSLDNAIVEYTTQQGIAVGSPYAAYPIWNSTPGWFALGIQSFPNSQEAALQIVADAGMSSIAAVVCAEVAACGAVDESMSALAPETTVRYDGVFKVAASAPNYTAECLALKDKGSEVLYMGVSVDVAKKLVSDCATQDYKPFFFAPYHAFNPQWADIADVSALSMLPTIPWFVDNAATADFRAAHSEFGDLSTIDESGMYVWVGLEAFRAAATAADLPENPTKEQVMDAMYALTGDLGGLIASVTFTAGEPSPVIRCYFVAGLENGEFTTPQGDEPVCLS
jgi:branched-chain amino acid transport system substrate-binding protein